MARCARRAARGRARLRGVARATDADVAALWALDVPLVARERQRAIVRESASEGTALAAWDDADLLGYVTWDYGFFGRAFVRLLVVAPSARRRGIGRQLVLAVETDVAERAAATEFRAELFISTEAINAPMQALLAGLGYAASGTIDNLNEPGNAELIYHKLLR